MRTVLYQDISRLSRQSKSGQPKSIYAALAYRLGTSVTDLRSGQVWDYSRKSGVIGSGIILADNAPTDWAQNPLKMWQSVDETETRSDSQLAWEFKLSLPPNLSDEQEEILVKTYCRSLAADGRCCHYVIHHKPTRDGKGRNHHVHILTTARKLDSSGKWERKLTKRQKLDSAGNRVYSIKRQSGVDRKGKPVYEFAEGSQWDGTKPIAPEGWVVATHSAKRKLADGTVKKYQMPTLISETVERNDYDAYTGERYEALRAHWIECVNAMESRTAAPVYYDHRSLKRQGVELAPDMPQPRNMSRHVYQIHNRLMRNPEYINDLLTGERDPAKQRLIDSLLRGHEILQERKQRSDYLMSYRYAEIVTGMAVPEYPTADLETRFAGRTYSDIMTERHGTTETIFERYGYSEYLAAIQAEEERRAAAEREQEERYAAEQRAREQAEQSKRQSADNQRHAQASAEQSVLSQVSALSASAPGSTDTRGQQGRAQAETAASVVRATEHQHHDRADTRQAADSAVRTATADIARQSKIKITAVKRSPDYLAEHIDMYSEDADKTLSVLPDELQTMGTDKRAPDVVRLGDHAIAVRESRLTHVRNIVREHLDLAKYLKPVSELVSGAVGWLKARFGGVDRDEVLAECREGRKIYNERHPVYVKQALERAAEEERQAKLAAKRAEEERLLEERRRQEELNKLYIVYDQSNDYRVVKMSELTGALLGDYDLYICEEQVDANGDPVWLDQQDRESIAERLGVWDAYLSALDAFDERQQRGEEPTLLQPHRHEGDESFDLPDPRLRERHDDTATQERQYKSHDHSGGYHR